MTLSTITVAELQPGDRIHPSQPSNSTYPHGIRGAATHVEYGPHVAIYLEETGDARWLIHGDVLVCVRRETA